MRTGRTRIVSDAEAVLDNTCAKIVIYILLVIIPIGLYYSEKSWNEKNVAFLEVRGLVEEVPDNQIPEQYVGKLVHLSTNSIIAEPQFDPEFHFKVAGALKLKRVTEYCQWREYVEHTEDDRGRKQKSYYYIKGWHSTLIPSLLFDQPFRHNNPLRDPYPSKEWVASSATIGAYTATQSLIENIRGYQYVDFRVSDVADFITAEASQIHGFKPIGNGYFYSPYLESTGSTIARLTGMFLEGSFDIQLGDLFSTCTAGDLRVSYQQVAPGSVSVIGQLVSPNGTLTTYKTGRGYGVGLMHPGVWNAQDMFDKELWDTWWGLLAIRVFLGLLWGLFFYIMVRKERKIVNGTLFWGTVISLVIYLGVHGINNLISSAQQYPFLAILTFIPTLWVWSVYYNTHHTTLQQQNLKKTN